jgi:pentatricopeptide repeat protein
MVRRVKNFRPNFKPKEVNTTYVNQQLDAFVERGTWKKGLTIFNEIQKNKTIAHITCYRKLVHLIGFTGSDLKKAREIFDVADKLKKKDVILFNIMIRCYSKVGHYSEAMRLYQYMKERGLNPNSFTYTFLLQGLKRAPEDIFQHFTENEIPKEKESFYVKKRIEMIKKIREEAYKKETSSTTSSEPTE